MGKRVLRGSPSARRSWVAPLDTNKPIVRKDVWGNLVSKTRGEDGTLQCLIVSVRVLRTQWVRDCCYWIRRLRLDFEELHDGETFDATERLGDAVFGPPNPAPVNPGQILKGWGLADDLDRFEAMDFVESAEVQMTGHVGQTAMGGGELTKKHKSPLPHVAAVTRLEDQRAADAALAKRSGLVDSVRRHKLGMPSIP